MSPQGNPVNLRNLVFRRARAAGTGPPVNQAARWNSSPLEPPFKPQIVLTHGEARGREPLAELIQKRFALKAALPFQGDVIKS